MNEETKRRIQAARAAGVPEDQIQRFVLMDQERQKRSKPAAPPPKQKTLLNKIGDAELLGVKLLPAATGTLGVIAGTPLGPGGMIAGGAAGAALGEGLRQTIDSEEGYQPADILEEGVYGAAGPVVGKVARVGGKLIKPLAKRLPFATEVAMNAGKSGKKIASGFLKETPSQWLRYAEAGIDPEALLMKYMPKLGTNMDEMLGPITRGKGFGTSGTIQAGIESAEEIIQGISKQAGKNIRIQGDDLMKAFIDEKKIMGHQLGSKTRMNALSGIIEEAAAKYKKGLTVNQAITTLREANKNFGEAVISDVSENVSRAAQQLEGNTLRKALRTMFPAMGDALDSQAELITLRELLKNTASKAATGGLKLGRLDLSRPGTFIDAAMTMPTVTGWTAKIAKAARGDYQKLSAGMAFVKRYSSQAAARMIGEGQGGLVPETGVAAAAEDFSQGPEGMLEETSSGPSAQIMGGESVEFGDTPAETPEASSYPTKDEFKEAYFNAIMAGDTKAATMIKTASEFLHEEGVGMTLSDSAIEDITDIESGIRGIDNLIGMIGEEGSQTGPIVGHAAKFPYAVGAKTLQAEIDRVRQKVGKALEGGVLRKEDEEKYKKILPIITDTEEVALNKLDSLKRELNADLSRFLNLQTQHGKGAGQPAAPENLRFAEENPEAFYNSPNDVDFNALYP